MDLYHFMIQLKHRNTLLLILVQIKDVCNQNTYSLMIARYVLTYQQVFFQCLFG